MGLLSPPLLSDREDNRKAEVLHFILLIQLAVQIYSAMGVIFVFDRKLVASLILLSRITIVLFCFFLLRRKKLNISSFLYILFFWVNTMFLIFFGGGTNSSMVYFFFSLTVTAAILFSLKWSLLFSLVNVCFFLVVALMERSGLQRARFFPEQPLSRWFTLTVYLFLTFIPVYIILRSYHKSLSDLETSSREKNKAELDLVDSQRRFEYLADHIPGIVFSVSHTEGNPPRFIYFNRGNQRVKQFKFIPGTPGYRNLGDNIHPEDRDLYLGKIKDCLESGKDLSFHGRWIDENDGVHWTQMSASVEKKKEETLINGVMLDITEQKNLEEKLYQSQKMEALGRLAGGVAHDFNNLLVPITGYMDLALQSLPVKCDEYGYIKTAMETVGRASRLTDQILAFSRKREMKWETVQLNQVIGRMVPLLRPILGKEIELELDLKDFPCPVRADENQLEQLIMNLAVNARDAMEKKGELIIHTEVLQKQIDGVQQEGESTFQDYLMLSVRDTGCGMEKETLEKIFEPFYTTKELGIGTGLGMSIVLGIVQQHGGHIQIDSEPGKGTDIKIFFPLSS